MKRHSISLFVLALLITLVSPSYSRKKKGGRADEINLPSSYDIDLQLGYSARGNMMAGAPEISGTQANHLGDDVFDRLVHTGFSEPFPWKLTLVNNSVVNANSSPGGQVYVYGGLLKLVSDSPGLWAAVLSHEISHTGLRHQVRVYLQELYDQRMEQYYRARIQAGDKSANWALLGFNLAAPITLKRMEREQEHAADQTGMLLMARAGYHPDYVFALHHLLRLQTGEESKFAAFFSDHPRWETRDQRDEKTYSDALAEYNRLWPDPSQSPGPPPEVAFVGNVQSKESKAQHAADVSAEISCRGVMRPVNILFLFYEDGKPIQDSTGQKPLTYGLETECPQRDGTIEPTEISIRSASVGLTKRTVEARIGVLDSETRLLEMSKEFKIKFPQ